MHLKASKTKTWHVNKSGPNKWLNLTYYKLAKSERTTLIGQLRLVQWEVDATCVKTWYRSGFLLLMDKKTDLRLIGGWHLVVDPVNQWQTMINLALDSWPVIYIYNFSGPELLYVVCQHDFTSDKRRVVTPETCPDWQLDEICKSWCFACDPPHSGRLLCWRCGPRRWS